MSTSNIRNYWKLNISLMQSFKPTIITNQLLDINEFQFYIMIWRNCSTLQIILIYQQITFIDAGSFWHFCQNLTIVWRSYVFELLGGSCSSVVPWYVTDIRLAVPSVDLIPSQWRGNIEGRWRRSEYLVPVMANLFGLIVSGRLVITLYC